MARLLKDYYDTNLIDRLASVLIMVYPKFNKAKFTDQIFDAKWKDLELKERIRHISLCLRYHLSGNFEEDVSIILRTVDKIEKSKVITEGVQLLFIPDYIEVFGADDYKTSIPAMERITQLISCEFTIRPFIIKYPKKTMKQMVKWSKHKHAMVRRLSTEGCRPRLPWAMAIPDLKKDPGPILPILERLKSDPSESVRRSVANNLNDISKDHPDLVIDLAQQWKGQSVEIDWVIKHGCRTLLKRGDQRALELIGFGKVGNVKIDQFKVLTPEVKIGEYLKFSFRLTNHGSYTQKLRLEYAIYYLKANGTHSKKVFKLSEKKYAGTSETSIEKKQSFRIITTRVFHKGKHMVSVIVNGIEGVKKGFLLK